MKDKSNSPTTHADNAPETKWPSENNKLDIGLQTLTNTKLLTTSDILQNTSRKSAFQPYRQVAQCTPLTNLQRGNTQAESAPVLPTDVNIHTSAGRGEISTEDIQREKCIDLQDENGYTPLHWAAAFGQFNAVLLLLNKGANIDAVGRFDETPLHLAADGGHHEVVRLLVGHGANVNQLDHFSNTPLMYAAFGNFPHTCNELLLGGANITLTNLNDDTAFLIAQRNNCDLSKSIIQKHILAKFGLS